MRRLRRTLAALTLTTATLAGTATLTERVTTTPGDTAWGSPATADDTAWGTLPTTDLPALPDINPLDTAWG